MKKLFILYSLCIMLVSLNLAAQEATMLYLKSYGGNASDVIGYSNIQTSDGKFICGIGTLSTSGPITDSFCDFPSQRSVFFKYSANDGLIEWSKCYPNSWLDTGYVYLYPTQDNGFIRFGEYNNGEKWLIQKENAVGAVVWNKVYGGNISQSLLGVLPTADGGYILAGTSYSTDGDVGMHYGSTMFADIWAIKIDSVGDKVWSKVIGGSQGEELYSIAEAPGDGCYLMGSTRSSDFDCTGNNGGGDAYVARLDSDGNLLWHKDIGGSLDDTYFGNAKANGSGGLICAFGTNSEDGDVHHHKGSYDICVLEIDSNGSITWDNCYGSPSDYEFPKSICKSTDGTIWVAGLSRTQGGDVSANYGGSDAWVLHIDGSGGLMGSKVLGSTGEDMAQQLYPLAGGLVLVGGYFGKNDNSFSSVGWYGERDVFLTMLAPWNTSVSNPAASLLVSLFPNPAHEKVTVTVSDSRSKILTVTDVLGRQVYKYCATTEAFDISITNWLAGLYYLEITNENGYRTVEKLVVQ